MVAKDIITAAIASSALIISFISLWRAIRADRRSSKVAFEQKKQEVLELFLENQLSQEARVRKLSQLWAQTPDTSHVNDTLDHFIGGFEATVSNIKYLQEQLREIPSSTLDSESGVALERLLGTGKQQKTYAPHWDNFVDEFIEAAQKLTALESALSEINMDLEGAEEERQRKEEELRRLQEQLAEMAQSADEDEEELTGDEEVEEDNDEEVEGDKPERP